MNSPDTHAGNEPGASTAVSHNVRLGLTLFFIYLASYLGFILLSAYAPTLMGRPSLGGMNFAVVYGFGLIIGAFVLAIIYMTLCRNDPVAGPEMTETVIASEFEKEEGGA